MAIAKTPSLNASTRPVSFTLELSAYGQGDGSPPAGGSHVLQTVGVPYGGRQPAARPAPRRDRGPAHAVSAAEAAHGRDIARRVAVDHRWNDAGGDHNDIRQSGQSERGRHRGAYIHRSDGRGAIGAAGPAEHHGSCEADQQSERAAAERTRQLASNAVDAEHSQSADTDDVDILQHAAAAA